MISLGLDIGGSSIKAALIRDGDVLAAARSTPYDRPAASELIARIQSLLTQFGDREKPGSIGLCLPGILADDRTHIVQCVNIPALENLPLQHLLPIAAPPPRIFNDAYAATFSYWHQTLPGRDGASGAASPDRLLGLALGTGVGACVLDDGVPMCVERDSPGHIGQIDVGPCDAGEHIGPDRGRNSLEAYIGAAALRAAAREAGLGAEEFISTLRVRSPPLIALVRAIRISHAIYRPSRVVLLGGLGVRLAHLARDLHAAVHDQLTSVARHDWTLAFGTSDFHAATGAALLAAR